MILSTFRSAAPFMTHFVVVFVISDILFVVLMQRFLTMELVEGALVPDAALTGYTPAQALEWYDVIGTEGRHIYTWLSLLDLFVIIPSYVFMLSCHLVMSSSLSNNTSNYYESLAYLPTMAAMFDLVESFTHLYSVLYYPFPASREMLMVASTATQFKFAFLGLCLASSAYYLLDKHIWHGRRLGPVEPTGAAYSTSSTSNSNNNSSSSKRKQT
jgi:hypothetical protein